MFDRAETLASERYNRDGDSVSPWQPERASVPELVDISVSDMCPYDCNYCAPPGTQVQTPDGDRPIEEIKLGDVVYSADPLTGQTIEETVTQVFERDYEGDLIEIELENGRILRLTPNHEVYTANRGWVEAGDLTEEDNLVGISEYAYA